MLKDSRSKIDTITINDKGENYELKLELSLRHFIDEETNLYVASCDSLNIADYNTTEAAAIDGLKFLIEDAIKFALSNDNLVEWLNSNDWQLEKRPVSKNNNAKSRISNKSPSRSIWHPISIGNISNKSHINNHVPYTLELA